VSDALFVFSFSSGWRRSVRRWPGTACRAVVPAFVDEIGLDATLPGRRFRDGAGPIPRQGRSRRAVATMASFENLDPVVLRILDANMNRAREALRVMEEFARFGLEDAVLSRDAKSLRHDLAGSVPAEVARGQVARRDIVGDVGCNVRTASEYRRSDASDVLRAAARRLSEALRAIEEYGKTVDVGFAAAVEQLRYRAYDLDRRLERTVDAKARFGHVRIYVLLTESLCAGDWFATAEAALRGGADCLQLREKHLPDRVLLDRARKLAALCRERGRLFIVNDRSDIAAAARADGVHLGQDDLTVADARRILPAHCLVGVSTHTIEQVEAAVAEAPDYIAVGPMFDTPTKPQEHVASPATLAAARSRTSLPLVAIGGIDHENAGTVLSALPCGLCVCRAIINRLDVADSVASLRELVESRD